MSLFFFFRLFCIVIIAFFQQLTFGHLCRCCISKQKRNNHLIRCRSCRTCRLNHHFQHSGTPRSSMSHKEEIPLRNSHHQNGVLKKAPSFEEDHAIDLKPTSLLSPSESSGKSEKIKKERSPILVIKAKLNAIKELSSPSKIMRHEFRSMEELSESKFTETEFLTHHEQLERSYL